MDYFKNCTVIWGVLFSFVVSTPLVAQQNSTDTVRHLEEIMIIEDYKKSEVRSTSPLQVLSAKDISELNVLQLSDAVKHFSGVTVKDYGGIGGLKTVSVRSLGANHTTVSYDGLALSDVQTGQIDIGRFSLNNVDMISLSSGQTDNIFQPAKLFASASVLNIVAKKPTFDHNDNFNGQIVSKGGSFGLYNMSSVFNWFINKHLTFAASGEVLTANSEYPYRLNYGVVGKDSTSVEQRKNSDVLNVRAEGMLYANLAPKTTATLKTYFYHSQRGLPGATIYYNLSNFSSQRIRDYTFFTQAHLLHNFNKKWSVQTHFKYNRAKLHYLDPAYLNSEGKTENNYLQQEAYTSVSTLYKLLNQLSVSVSADYIYNVLEADLYQFSYPQRHTLLTAFAAKYVHKHLLATTSLLYTQTAERVKTGVSASDNEKLSPYISLSIKPFDAINMRFRMFYKNIFRVPTFNDLYYTRIGNPKLKPEDTNQFNVGITYVAVPVNWLSYFSVTVDAYRNAVKNKIVAYPTKNIFEWTMLNYGKVDIDGVDANIRAIVLLTDRALLTVGGSYTYQRALNRTSETDKNYNHQIPYTPRVSGAANAAVETVWFRLAYTLVWSGHRYALAENLKENRVGGYADHSLSASKDVQTSVGKFTVNVEVLNFLNKNYEVVRYFPMPGRSIRGTLVWKF